MGLSRVCELGDARVEPETRYYFNDALDFCCIYYWPLGVP